MPIGDGISRPYRRAISAGEAICDGSVRSFAAGSALVPPSEMAVSPPLARRASRRDRLDRLAADVDQGDIWAVIGLPVAGIDAEPLAADDVARREHLSDLRIVHDLSDLAANKLGREVIGRLIVE